MRQEMVGFRDAVALAGREGGKGGRERESGRGREAGKGEGALDLDICPGPPSS